MDTSRKLEALKSEREKVHDDLVAAIIWMDMDKGRLLVQSVEALDRKIARLELKRSS